MRFKRVPRNFKLSDIGEPIMYLIDDNWDDFSFRTTFKSVVYDEENKRHDLGILKIGCIGQDESRTEIDESFSVLKDNYFSLGQSVDYYLGVRTLSKALQTKILSGLNDVVYNADLLLKVSNERVMTYSLLRDVSLSTVKNQFRRLIDGGDILTEYHFGFVSGNAKSTMDLDFHVNPEANPPTNIHVIIGSNGVGKTSLLNHMIESVLKIKKINTKHSQFYLTDEDDDKTKINDINEIFSGVVSVAFSAFDPFTPLPEEKDKTKSVKYSYIGLKRVNNIGGKIGTHKSKRMLENEFAESLYSCCKKEKSNRWLRSIRILESDVLLKDHNFGDLIDLYTQMDVSDSDEDTFKRNCRNKFRKLSSGHAITMLTITKLVEVLEEKTLVLMDEPESHLHPPLLSSFIRAVSELLIYKNGVAIIATHSPIILQEVPKVCVWKIKRFGEISKAERPQKETFGENVGLLTSDIFGLEVTESGFHTLLNNEIRSNPGASYKKILRKFDGQLGSEAKMILQGLLYSEGEN
ncbi:MULTISPECIES: AAA family ATPase [Enterobacter]|uniref:AAA family ATPase n=1 Tax=Enterobacter TaxID=547 RepID=UPI0015F3DD82|nr:MULTISPECIES: AAA family ATPase [Enterobacter]MBT1827777.1 AAA family ATPase [Enterobacter bugandensis]